MKKAKNLAITILMITIIMILSTKIEATTGKVNSETVRLRKEPNTKSTILEQLDKNDEVEILEKLEGWYKVKATVDGEKITGYISKELVDLAENKEEEPESKTETLKNDETENTSNIEETNGTTENNSVETSTIPQENKQESNENQIINEVNIEKDKEYTLEQAVNIKVLPLINSREKSAIETGTIRVVEIINDWCKIENDTQYGWARINLIKKSIVKKANTVELPTEETQNPIQEITPNQELEEEPTISEPETSSTTVTKNGYVSAEGLKVRKEPSTSSDELDSLKKNDKISIIGEVDGWYKIEINDGIGYVSAKYISDTKVPETTSRGTNTSRTNEVTEITKQNEEKEEPETTENTEKTTDASTSAVSGEAVVEYAKQYIGYKYVSGGALPSTGFDCSGFTKYVYQNFGITLNRSSKDQIKNGTAVEKSNLKAGDLVVFNGESNKTIGHVGIYVGNGNFIHASNPKGGVKITSLTSDYYNQRYVVARRVL